MFTIKLELRNATKSVVAPGARRALWELQQMRERYGVEPTVTDGHRTYSEDDLRKLC